MWNLSGDDILHAKEELKGRRAAIQAHYDNEIKRLEADIANLETFEQAALKFVANFKGGGEAASVEGVGAASGATEGKDWEAPVEDDADSGSTGDEAKSGSRWRVRFGGAEASP